MKVVSVMNTKGGVGKSTLTSNLVGFAKQMGFEVAICDLDKQNTLTYWHKKSKLNLLELKIDDLNKIKKTKNIDYLFIDTPAAIKKNLIYKITEISNFCIIPFTESMIDIRITKKFLGIFKKYKNNKKLKFFLVLNKLRFSKNNILRIKDIEDKLQTKVHVTILSTKNFDKQMEKGSIITKSNYSKTFHIRDQLINLINKI